MAARSAAVPVALVYEMEVSIRASSSLPPESASSSRRVQTGPVLEARSYSMGESGACFC